MTLFWLLGLVVLLEVLGRLWSWEAWLKPWLQVARVPARRQPVWQRDWDVHRSSGNTDTIFRPMRDAARARSPVLETENPTNKPGFG